MSNGTKPNAIDGGLAHDELKQQAFDFLQRIHQYVDFRGCVTRKDANWIADNTDAPDVLLDALTESFDAEQTSLLYSSIAGSIFKIVEKN